jgi:acyl-coenzyme A synthetase/AMP-(fatty) acid ligase
VFTDLNTILSDKAARLGDKVYIESVDQGKRITFDQLNRVTNRLAHFLKARGITANDRVSILAENSIEALIIFFGIQRYGATLNAINLEIREKNVRQILQDVRPKLALWSRDLPSDPRPLGEGVAAPWIAFGAWDAGAWREDDLFAQLQPFSDTEVPGIAVRKDGLCFVNYTSGTTDRPKGVLVTHDAYFCQSESTVDRLELTEADTVLDYRHFSWSSPQILSIGPSLQTGARLVLARKFSQARFFEWLRAYDVTVAVGIPTVINMLLSRPVAVTRADLPHLRFMTSSTAPLSLDRQLEFERQYGIPVVQLAGGTETGFMAGNPPERRRRGSIGLPTLNMTVRILDDAGRECGPEQEGEMVVSGRQMASGYLVDADTIVPIPPEGHHTGDLARCDREGYVYITGRKKDIIIKGGVNIAALEITNALLQHPDAAEAATIGVPDAIYGEAVVSFVAPRAGQRVTPAEMLAHCRTRLSGFKVPEHVIVLDAIPKNDRGKVARDVLEALWRGAVTPP